MIRTMIGKNEGPFWAKMARGEILEEDWKEFIKNESLSAAVDFPMSLYWKDLMKMYPNAKVLLTVRDPIKWYNSVKNTIRQMAEFMKDSPAAIPMRIVQRIMGKEPSALYTCTAPTYLGAKYPSGLFGAIDAGQETAVRFFNNWNQQVIDEVPSERLLVFEVKNGWEPLCKFLGVPKERYHLIKDNITNENFFI